jgi:uncharacterized LabA/DUF88 family protein
MSKAKAYCFVDSSNLFYGGVGRMTWQVDYKKLKEYLEDKYGVKRIFYYSGVETHGYEPPLKYDQEYPIQGLYRYLNRRQKTVKKKERNRIKRDIQRAKFLKKIQTFGYTLRLKPIKHIKSYDGTVKMKANCDVDLTFDVIRLEKEFDNLILLSGDGDFELLVRYFKEKNKDFYILANAWSTARIYRYQYSKDFREFSEIKDAVRRQ